MGSKRGILRHFIPVLVGGLGFFVLIPGVSSARLVNYENDPDLKIAMQADAECNGGDMKATSQTLAEEYYLKYLKKCKESSQRAKVYCHLGKLFATNWHAQKGEKPDYAKSVMYMKKALEEEPRRLGEETLSARGFLLTPLNNREETVEIRLKDYAWLLKTREIVNTADEKSDIWLPDIPGRKLRSDRIKSFRNLLESVLESEAANLAADASSFPNPKDKVRNLQRIIDRFPHTKAADEAAKKLSVVREKMKKGS